MITRPDDPYRGLKRTLRVALLVSILIHPIIVALLGLTFPLKPPHADRSKQDPTEIVTISSSQKKSPKAVAQAEPRPTVPRPQAAPKTEHTPQPERIVKIAKIFKKPVTLPTYRPRPPEKRELAKIAPGTPVPEVATEPPSTAPPVRERPQREVSTAPPKTVAYERPAMSQQQSKAGRYSDAQLAQINSDLAKTTNAMRGENNPLSDVNRQVAASAPRHYNVDFQALAGNMRSAQGICDPIKDWTMNGYDYYYLACNVQEPDGSLNRKPLPWPVRYRPNSDPFNGYYQGAQSGPIAGPLPGWHPDPGHPLDPDFLAYARLKGYLP